MKYELHDDVLEHRRRTRAIKTLGWWCSQCGEAILAGDALQAHERAFQELRAEVEQALDPDQRDEAGNQKAILDELTAEAQKLRLGY